MEDPRKRGADVESPGDSGAPDIVGRTGEEMPRQSHDDVVDDDRGTGFAMEPDKPERADERED